MKQMQIIISTFLQVFGSLWLCIEAISFFSQESSDNFKAYWWVFFLIGIVILLFKLYPKKRFHYKVANKDIWIELRIGDIFKEDGDLVVGFNKELVVTNEIIARSSIQGLFTHKYFNKSGEITTQIEAQKKNSPEMGDTYTIKAKGKIAYFCVISEINGNGVAKSTLENIRMGLSGLWVYISENAEKSVINIPILGSGFSRVSANREELIREIIFSFLASLNEHSYCNGLRIVVHPNDIKKFNMNIEEINQFIEYNCKFGLVKSDSVGVGKAIGD